MIISVINHTNGQISDEELETAIRAINRQIREDFEPYWSLGATLRLEGRSQKSPGKQDLADMRGDAVIYMWNQTDMKDALGYHDQNNRGIPYGFVFTDLSAKLGENWTVTLSHEARSYAPARASPLDIAPMGDQPFPHTVQDFSINTAQLSFG